ncbi:unnamed protein product [Aureobasidium mustum]|uniref:Uncharacterized protein n=1 Tax=Aureobasidium mustum TaxID=2773714 RepID=A0A9N8K2K0_9PEZI|nr:unnamed protein product [Aureobasidium mustum]
MKTLVVVPEKRKPSNLDPTSAHERTCLVLAHTVVHEFFHAFNAAWFPRVDDETPVSAWLQGNRSNELGNAAINRLLGGEPFTMHRYSNDAVKEHRQHCAVPYGLFSRVPWDLWEDTNDQFQKTKIAGTQDAFAARQVFYPVPQKYVHNMFTKETWEHQVPRFGIAALRVPHLEDWAITHKKPH